MPPADLKTLSLITSFFYRCTRCCLFLSLSGSKTLALHRHGNRESPHVAKGTREKIWFFFWVLLFFFSDKVWESYSAAPLWAWTWVCMCFPCGPIWFEFSPDLAESASLFATDGFTWPCPRPRPFRFYLSGTPISASLSSAPATRNKAPEGGQKGLIWKKKMFSTCNLYFQNLKNKGRFSIWCRFS